eukprot:14638974-Alexandrium_andersonii.AAC.1
MPTSLAGAGAAAADWSAAPDRNSALRYREEYGLRYTHVRATHARRWLVFFWARPTSAAAVMD